MERHILLLRRAIQTRSDRLRALDELYAAKVLEVGQLAAPARLRDQSRQDRETAPRASQSQMGRTDDPRHALIDTSRPR